jgi:hypothetical protein
MICLRDFTNSQHVRVRLVGDPCQRWGFPIFNKRIVLPRYSWSGMNNHAAREWGERDVQIRPGDSPKSRASEGLPLYS